MSVKSRHLWLSLGATLALFVVAPAPALAQEADLSDRDGGENLWTITPNGPEECRSGTITPLSLVHPWQGEVELDRVHCLKVELQAGEFVRAVVEMDDDLGEQADFAVHVHAPGASNPVLQLGLSTVTFPRRPLSWEATEGGAYHLLLRDLFIWPETTTSVPARVWIEAVESPAQVEARREALAADPRVDWLNERALPVRSISPDDVDFSDLEPLREKLEGVRMVLLGEADHNAGTDFLARSRLVKFLHQELGFDVLAFESGLFSMSAAWNSLRAGMPIDEAFSMGNWWFWSTAEQMQSLIAYVGEQAAGERPLELAGFGNRPWIWGEDGRSMATFAEGLSGFLREKGMGGPLADSGSSEYRVLAAHSAQQLDPRPEPTEGAALLAAVDETIAELERSSGHEAAFWAEALRGVGCHVREVYWSWDRETDFPPKCRRNQVMGEHLVWLAQERYPDRKIIAWAATGHISRHAGEEGPAMGKVVWDAIGEESYAIGMTSYRSAENRIVVDQHPLPEFEQLMEAAGFEYALVDLREAAREDTWAGGSFLARPRGHETRERVWSDDLDALFFVREQERRRRIDE